MRDETGSVDSYTSVVELQDFIMDVITRKYDTHTKQYFNISKLKDNLYSALRYLISYKDADIAKIPEDDKFYLNKTKYRIEIRDCAHESSTWLTYVAYQDISFDTFANRLLAKYIYLIDHSNPLYFNGNVE